VIFVAAMLAGCSSPDARQVFERDVVDALERGCSASNCHGVPRGAEKSGEVVDWGQLHYTIDGDMQIVDVDQAYRAAIRVINTEEDPGFSSLLRKPLDRTWGGSPHFGGDNYLDLDDPDYQAIAAWIELEARGGEAPEPLTAREQQFADTVQPVLQGMMCFNASCHGPDSSIPYRLDPGVRGEFSNEILKANYAATAKMLSLDGDAMQSRLVRKALPLHAGGIRHKGGNIGFFDGPDDPRLASVLDWVCAERTARVGSGCGAPSPTGVVFVRGPLTAEHPFDADVFTPGTDLWLAHLDADGQVTHEENLTSSLHGTEADVRDPAVDTTGRMVAFALRPSADQGHDLYTLDLDTRAVVRLTDDAAALPEGGVRTWRDPAWAPDGTLWATSTRDGLLADAGDRLDTELYQLDPESGAATRRSWTPHVERKLTFYTVGGVGGDVAFSALRDAVPDQGRAHVFRFPPGLKEEYHQHFGITLVEDLVYEMRELPDGNYLTLLGDLDDRLGAGLAVVDRNMGPELNDSAASDIPSLPGYLPPMTRLDPDGAWTWRDPAALPDGRFVVARTTGASDDFEIAIAALSESVDGSGPSLGSVSTLIDAPGVADFDPEPVVLRAAGKVHDRTWDPDARTSTFVHQGMQTIDGLLDNLHPSGTKVGADNLVSVRLVEALRALPAQRRPVPPEDTRHGISGASTTGLGPLPPSRILGELPLAADGSFQVELPATTAMRIQGLDADGMASGKMHNRWYDFAPGQTIKQGVNAEHYPQLCAGCHGALDGDPDHTFIEPDVITNASLTLARYQDQNPRRPIPAALLGDDTRVSIDFQTDVQPVLATRCGGCHGGATPAAGLSLTHAQTTHFDDAYESLLQPGDASSNGWMWVDATGGSARNSHLIEVLIGAELDAPATLSSHTPHGGLQPDELAVLIRWIDLGATFRGAP